MRRIIMIGTVGMGCLLMSTNVANAQIEIIGEALKRVIMAIDLRIQKAQTQTIFLQDAQKELENIMQQTRLADISDWVRQQKELYDGYYQELWQVKNALRYYSAVREMIDKQARMISGYRQAYTALVRDGHFSGEEIGSIVKVYESMLQEGASVVDGLSKIINAFISQMDDGDRLALINDLSARIDLTYRQLQAFTQGNILLSLQRAKDAQDANMIKSMYGIH